MPDHATVYATIQEMPPIRAWARLVPDATADLDDAAATVTFTWPDGLTVQITRMRDAHVPTHLHELQALIRQRGGGEGTAIRALGTLSIFTVAAEVPDERATELAANLTAATDGFCQLGDQLLDDDGRDLLAEPALPDAARVARRALVLLAAAFRGLLEDDAGKPDQPRAEALRGDLARWLRATAGLADEVEPDELAFLETPIGGARRPEVVHRVWAAEGAQVLLWALAVRALPAFDDSEHPYAIARDVGVLGDEPSPILAAPALRDAVALEAQRRRLLAIHWRLVEQRVHPGPVDFRGFARTAWFGGFELADLPLAGDDLAIGDLAVHLAPPPALRMAASSAVERHRAANWLVGAHPIYSSVATPT